MRGLISLITLPNIAGEVCTWVATLSASSTAKRCLLTMIDGGAKHSWMARSLSLVCSIHHLFG